MAWSRNARLFAWEEGQKGCLPLDPIVDAIFKSLKFKGYVSLETFSRHLFDKDPEVPNRFATRAMDSWNTALKRMES
ncbi:Fc.00g011170.m01.CDS01 [Cosmosporella sp. VM-42]